MDKKSLFLRKPISDAQEAASPDGSEPHQLKRHLSSIHLIAIGIGAVIGAGIFVITGQAAAQYAGPAVVYSFLIAAVICLFSGLCYGELSSLIPISGGSYSYSYVAMGEFPAWIVGWSLIVQLLLSASTVAVGWSGYFVSLLADCGVDIPTILASSPIHSDEENGLHFTGAILNVPAIALVALIGIMIAIGIRAVTHFNNAMVVIKLAVIVLIIVLGIPSINSENWTPFIPPNNGHFGEFGFSGILRGAGLVFFAYIGFDTVSTLSQEAIRPQKSVPIGILGSLGISMVVYIITALVLTGVASYKLLNVPDPMSIAINAIHPNYFWLGFAVKLAILAGLASVVLITLLGQTRTLFSISRDGLLPKSYSRVHHKLRSPLFATWIAALATMILAGIFPIAMLGNLTSMATLFLFTVVCLGVLILRYRHPNIKRPFKVPFVPYIPALGIVACILQMFCMPLITWVQFLLWTALGLFVYFFYSKSHSHLRKKVEENEELKDTLY